MTTATEYIAAAREAYKSQQYQQAEQYLTEVLALSITTTEQIEAYTLLSEILIRRGEFSRSLEKLQQALLLTQSQQNEKAEIRLFCNAGIALQSMGNYPEALEKLQHSFAIAERLDRQDDMERSLTYMGNAYFYLSDYPKALDHWQRALLIAEAIQNQQGIATILGNLGNIHAALADHKTSLEYYLKAVALYEEAQRKDGLSGILSNIGIVYYHLSEHDKSLEYFHKSLHLDETSGKKEGIAAALTNIGNVYQSLHELEKALEYFSEALAINEELGRKTGISINLVNIGNIYSSDKFLQRNDAIAEEYFLRSIAISQEIGAKKQLYEQHKLLAELYKTQGRWQECQHHFELFHDIEKEVQSEQAKRQALLMEQRRQSEERERQLAIERAQAETMENLLYKTFPAPIVHRLKAGEVLVAEQFDSVSVLFADLVGFTKLSLLIKPTQMIELLNHIFSGFDTIIKQQNGHRLRTMGDGYFAICGAPDIQLEHSYLLAKAALAMRTALELPTELQQLLPADMSLGIRIGLHCGAVVGGLVGGLEKWQYDMYGDTVNTASRMESHGEPGKIHITEDFKNSLSKYNEFEFIPREPMFIKGKGLMNTYFLQ